MEVCGAARGFLFALGMGFGGYLVLAVWLWVEKERSFREDPEEHLLKGLWLLRGLVCLMVISFVWGMMVLREGGREGGAGGGGCWVGQRQLHECVVAFVLLGSTLLFVALFLHGMATGTWALVSIGQVLKGVGETMGLCLSLVFGLAPREKLLLRLRGQKQQQQQRQQQGEGGKWGREGRKERRQGVFLSSSASNVMMVQVAEELPLLPFFHIRVIEGGGGGGREGGNGREETPRGVESEREGRSQWSAFSRFRHGEGSKHQHQGEETTPQLPLRASPYTPPLTPTTPIGRVLGRRGSKESEKQHQHQQQQEQRRPRSRFGFRLDDDDEEEDEGKGTESENEDEDEDDAELPAAVRVSLTPGEEEEEDEDGSDHHRYHIPRPLVLGATLNSIFDVTPLSLSPLRPRSALAEGGTEGLYLNEEEGGGGGRGGGRGHAVQGNTCCPLPPLQV